ncbi:FAD binding domain-containing protein [Crucibulum laeve]|uniref:FAD binding domain-containing protein n=1 Tax=Crucibulum laeve TaxID=68775 RepID=A0A5C3M3I3_9AGAR|nr:FAD binding domain-containing protein [Crucibulum laeve]
MMLNLKRHLSHTSSADTLKPTPPSTVLIVGGGPSGLILGIILLQNGIPVRIIEKNALPRLGQRGAGIMPRTLELFTYIGIIDEVLKLAIPIPPARMYKLPGGAEPIHDFDMAPPVRATPSTPFLAPLMLGQDRLEKLFHAKLAEFGVSVELGTELASFSQTADHVDVKLLRRGMDPEAEGVLEDSTYEWMIGTDGARGVVRKQLGLTFLGERAVENFVVGDICADGLSQKHWHMWGDAGSTFLRGTETPKLFNFVVTGPNINHKELFADQDTLRRCFYENTGKRPDVKFGDIPWISCYTPNIRMVDKFGKGRVFIAGDAAHVHSPTGGQGMNTGVQDSFNLGWKLALIIKKLAPVSLIESFNEERLPVIAEMLSQTTQMMKQSSGEDDCLSPGPWKTSGSLFQLGVNYRWSPIVLDERKRMEEEIEAEEDDYLKDYEFGDNEEDEKVDSYGLGSDGRLRAGDRAPDATGLVDRSTKSSTKAHRLFHDIFSTSHHTVLVFPELADCKSVLHALTLYPKSLIRSVVVVRRGRPFPTHCALADTLIEDRGGHAHEAYVSSNVCGVVVVRPDGMVGAIVQGPEWMHRYFRGIFASGGRR